jgi:hypothetical protein
MADDDVAAEFGGIEGVERLAEFVEHEVGDIDDVVDRAQADGFEALFEPGGGFLDGDAGDADGGVERAGGGGLDDDWKRARRPRHGCPSGLSGVLSSVASSRAMP